YFDAVPVNRVAEAEKELLRFMREEKSEVRNAIIESKNITDDTEKALRAALDEFRKRFAESSK
ncbi:MAG: F0F1 ATP synthase subunit alpha, partial [Planctomycetaceae bacterium]